MEVPEGFALWVGADEGCTAHGGIGVLLSFVHHFLEPHV